jgi:uncharacterized membrane protein
MQPMSYQPDKMKFYSIVNYLPEVLGLTLGRLLKLSAVLCIYMGKLFVLLLYIWATYRAIKRTPVGKGVFFVTATLPMSLMMSGAISYDPMVILSTISLISCIFELCEKKNSKTVFIETLIWVFVVGAVKGGGFLILLPLAFMLIDKKNLKKSIITVACIIGIGIFSVVLFNKIIPAGMEFFQLGTDGNGKLTAAYALQHPLNFLDMSIKAYLGDFDLLTLNQGGYALAWLEGTLPLTLVAIMMVLGGVYSIFEKDEMKFRQRDKYVFIAVILVSVISTPAMLLSWTNVVSRAILGLQGRYYLPLLPLALFVMTKFSLHHPLEDGSAEETSDGAAVRKRILIMYMIVSCVAVYYMMRLYLTRG